MVCWGVVETWNEAFSEELITNITIEDRRIPE
jgi:hypothetical protein